MRIISTIEELKNYVSATASFKFDKIAPHINRTMQGYIKKLLGEDLTEEICTAYESALEVLAAMAAPDRAKIVAEGRQYTLMPAKYQQIMPYLQDAVSNISFMNSLSQMQMSMSESGIRLLVNENSKTAFQWQIDDLKYQLASDGYSALNSLLETLDAHKADFSAWETSDAYADQKKYFVENPDLFNNAYYIANSRITYLTLRYIMQRIEQFEVQRLIGPTLFQKLKTNQKTSYSDREKILMNSFIIPGIVLLTVAKGIVERAIEVTDLGVQPNLYTYYVSLKDARKKYQFSKERDEMIKQLTDDGYEFLQGASDFIASNPEEFGPIEVEESATNFRVINKPERGIFGM